MWNNNKNCYALHSKINLRLTIDLNIKTSGKKQTTEEKQTNKNPGVGKVFLEHKQ